MVSLTESFFHDIANRGYDPLLCNISGNIQWNIAEAGTWYVEIEKGNLRISKKPIIVESVCEVEKEDFDKMVTGEQNPLTLFLQMKVHCTGNMGLVQIFHRLFPDDAVKKGVSSEQ